jgi:hypothetical protein
MDTSKLSPTSRATKILIGDRIPEGYQINEIATSLGRPASWVSERLNELRNELLLQTGHFFPLTDHEFASLEASILEHGIQIDVLLGQHIPLIDGRHRALIAQKHSLEIPCRLLEGLTEEQEHELAISLNAARRQLTRSQRKQLVQAELMRNPARSDRLLGAICGVHGETVAAYRAEIAAQQTFSAPTTPSPETGSAQPPAVDPPERRTSDGRGIRRPEPRPTPAEPTRTPKNDLVPTFRITTHLDGDDSTTMATENVHYELKRLLDDLLAEKQIRAYTLTIE